MQQFNHRKLSIFHTTHIILYTHCHLHLLFQIVNITYNIKMIQFCKTSPIHLHISKCYIQKTILLAQFCDNNILQISKDTHFRFTCAEAYVLIMCVLLSFFSTLIKLKIIIICHFLYLY